MDLWQTLAQFVFRLAFGIAFSMAITSPKQVLSGFFRVHLWVLLGLHTFAALAVVSARESILDWQAASSVAAIAAVVSYVGAVLWLYESKRAGIASLVIVAILSLVAAVIVMKPVTDVYEFSWIQAVDTVTGGLMLGSTMTAMLLGHWYLNSPSMQLAPLRKLVLVMGAAIIARALVCGIGLGLEANINPDPSVSWWLFVSLRWLSGLFGTALLGVLTWKTLNVPNTQSATGILYAAVIVVFIGELTSQLLTVNAFYPV